MSQPIFSNKPKPLISPKLSIGIGLIIIAGLLFYVGAQDINTEDIELTFDVNIIDTGLIPEEPTPEPWLDYYDKLPANEQEIIRYAFDNPNPHAWKTHGYDWETTNNIERLKDRIDNDYSCFDLRDAFHQNPGWVLRSYIAHKFIEGCA